MEVARYILYTALLTRESGNRGEILKESGGWMENDNAGAWGSGNVAEGRDQRENGNSITEAGVMTPLLFTANNIKWLWFHAWCFIPSHRPHIHMNAHSNVLATDCQTVSIVSFCGSLYQLF